MDAKKAFDHVQLGLLGQGTDRFGFVGPIFSAIMALYTNHSAQVYTSGVLSDPFDIANGTGQGCPLSPLIFNLLIEPLACYIRNHLQISGFSTHNSSHVISLFADDVILMLTDVEKSLALIHQVLQMFSRISYYKVNEKNHIIWV